MTFRSGENVKVYGHLSSGNCYKVYLTLKQLDIPFQWITVNNAKGETRTPEFLAKNPNGKIPLLEAEPGKYLPESNAILHYVATGSTLRAADPYREAQILQWLFWEQYSHEPYIATSRYVKHLIGNPPERQADLDRWRGPGYAALDLLERHLAHNDFLVDIYSIADIALYAYTHVAHEGGFDMSRYGAINAWLSRVRQRPGYVSMEQALQAQS
jgi:glutathione S-transferase